LPGFDEFRCTGDSGWFHWVKIGKHKAREQGVRVKG
jgi:hypothetical protein